MKENFSIENLIKIGLTESEAKIYLNLLKKKSFTASEVSRLSGISRSKTYEVLHQLVRKGLCIEILGGVKKYASANPKTAFNGLQQKLQQETENKKILMSNLSDTLSPLYLSEKENIDPMDYIQVLREKSRIVEKVESLERIVKEEVLSFSKAPYAMNISKTMNEEEFRGLERGVKYKGIYEVAEARKLDFIKRMEMYMESGEELRVAYELPMKMMIFDGKTVIFALRDRITSMKSLTSMVIEHPDITKAFKITFYSVWEKAMTLEEFKIKEKV
ncbi:MAG: TrmB family transcriptional regulator [Candidatus Cloacimonetes bacterium]|nr:TrmB family transcriptional regulator [Candidatus Cloacimonadota bacterium]